MSRADVRAPRTRWLRLHPVTLAFVVMVGGWLAVSQIQAETPSISYGGLFGPFVAHRGWPFAMVDRVSRNEQRPLGLFTRIETHVHAACVAANIAVWIVLVGCGVYVCERMIRAHFRFSLQTVFTLVTAAAVLLALHHYAPRLIHPVESGWSARLPALLCVAITLGTAIHIVCLCCASVVRRSQRPGSRHTSST
jgi:hypothetical protein